VSELALAAEALSGRLIEAVDVLDNKREEHLP
jgi:hypothetical protein